MAQKRYRNTASSRTKQYREELNELHDKMAGAKTASKVGLTVVGVSAAIAAIAPVAIAKKSRNMISNMIDSVGDELNYDLEHMMHETRHHQLKHPQGPRMKKQLPYLRNGYHDYDGHEF